MLACCAKNSHATAQRNNVQGWTVFQIPSTLGLLEPSDQTRASPMGRGLRQGLGRPPQAGLGPRERDAALLGLVGEGPPAIEDPRNLALAAGKLREVHAARHVAVFGRPPPQVLRRTGS